MNLAVATSVDGLVVAVTLGCWFAASALVQLPFPGAQRLREWDPLGLLPRWSFFAPQPATGDFHLLYRYQLADGALTNWAEFRNLQPRHWWHALWNPGRRRNKALFDLTTALGLEGLQYGSASLPGSVHYLTLLNFVTRLAHPPFCTAVQFLLMLSYGEGSDKEPTVLLSSNMHQL
jgi:hypothetical protein